MTGPALIAPDATQANRVLDSQRQGDGDASEEGVIFLMMPLLTFLTQHEVVFPGSVFAFFFFFSICPNSSLFSIIALTQPQRLAVIIFFFWMGSQNLSQSCRSPKVTESYLNPKKEQRRQTLLQSVNN